MIFVVVFFAIHVGRLDAEWTWLGMLTPAAATLGDIVAALVLVVGRAVCRSRCCGTA